MYLLPHQQVLQLPHPRVCLLLPQQVLHLPHPRLYHLPPRLIPDRQPRQLSKRYLDMSILVVTLKLPIAEHCHRQPMLITMHSLSRSVQTFAALLTHSLVLNGAAK